MLTGTVWGPANRRWSGLQKRRTGVRLEGVASWHLSAQALILRSAGLPDRQAGDRRRSGRRQATSAVVGAEGLEPPTYAL